MSFPLDHCTCRRPLRPFVSFSFPYKHTGVVGVFYAACHPRTHEADYSADAPVKRSKDLSGRRRAPLSCRSSPRRARVGTWVTRTVYTAQLGEKTSCEAGSALFVSEELLYWIAQYRQLLELSAKRHSARQENAHGAKVDETGIW